MFRRMVAQRFREPPFEEPEGEDAAGYEQRREEAAAAVLGHFCARVIAYAPALGPAVVLLLLQRGFTGLDAA